MIVEAWRDFPIIISLFSSKIDIHLNSKNLEIWILEKND